MTKQKISFVIIATLLFFSCATPKAKDYGSVKGSVFWKYNNYVGNRADAGASVDLYSLEDSTIKYSTKIDLQGNFSMDSVPVGKYIIITVSENTTGSPYDHFKELSFSPPELSNVIKYDLNGITVGNYERLHDLDSLARAALYHGSGLKALDKHAQLRDSLHNDCHKLLNSIPFDKKLKLGSFINKFDVKRIEVKKGEAKTIVVDFGITYI